MDRIKCNDAFAKQANLQELEYLSLLSKFKEDPDNFWAELARESIYFEKDFEEVFSYTQKPFFQWFKGGKTNISYNCIDRHLEKNADKTAIIFENEQGDNKKLSYQELYNAVCNCAEFLKKQGIKKGDYITIYMPTSIEAIVLMQACMRIGAVHSVVFAGFSATALEERIKDLKSKYIFTSEYFVRKDKKMKLSNTAIEACSKLNFEHKLLSFDIDWQLSYEKPGFTEIEWLDSEDPSFVLYTSGSTGKPKGLQHSTAGYLLWTYLTSKWVFDLKKEDIYFCTASIGWITGHSYLVYGPLANAATVLVYYGAPNHPSESRFWQLIEKYKVSIFYTAPTAIRSFMQWGDDKLEGYDLSSLRLLGSVGEPINPAAWKWFYEKVGNENCPIVDTWWQTETGGIVITSLPGVNDMKPGSAGHALPGTQAKILDLNKDHESGLLYLENPLPSMARTIVGDPQRYIKTYWDAENFGLEADPDENFYFPGDAAEIDKEGFIKLEGRIDDVINVSGHRLGTAEIESALVAYPGVSEAAVVSIPHELKGEAIIAFVVDAGSDENDLKQCVVNEIGALARPEKIIQCTALPKTRSGKIMRRLLKDIAQGKKPQGDLSTIEDAKVIDQLVASSQF